MTKMKDKITIMTDLLEDIFEITMISHRAGRWSFDERYARVLIEHGYKVDCSVTPHVSWQKTLGDPTQVGGTDYTSFPNEAYFLDLSDISKPGKQLLLEIPVTINKYWNDSISTGTVQLIQYAKEFVE